MNDHYTLSDLQRRLDGLFVIGVVHEVNYNKSLARVKVGENITGFLPWLASRAGADKTWHALEVGEQVAVLDPFSNAEQGVIIGSLYQGKHAAPSNNVNEHITEYKDGTKTSYNRESHTLTIDVVKSGPIHIKTASGEIHINGDKVHMIDRNGQNFGVVTGGHICQYTGLPHSHCSKTVTAEK
ncbi:phage baseplate assembly protein V [Piscirickettsia litoralis]|uniref:Gp5/Type VI secretion system Vgr protein OB-fold domain-containing protein n=1 Tax=Piscirickettsia litoralis TaxID=1891921 RepID=A0ABX2ZZV5_9GAMM|nr:phage baseplate assembly protein V [Piscirickettsia litoralis]ODN41557.1 hypothetical protein BGC07_15730 [Piscirickettsia litoralis]